MKTQNPLVLTDDLLQTLRKTGAVPPPDRIQIRAAGRILFLAYDDIEWFEAVGNYVRVHAGQHSHMMRRSISTVAQKLPEDLFVRIHRSRIVNTAMIRELQRCKGSVMVVLRNGKRFRCSHGYRAVLQRLIDGTTPL
jgi:two-component system LytT family response regulator